MSGSDIINHDMTPNDVNNGADHMYKVGNGVIIAQPTYLIIPEHSKESISKYIGHNVTKLNILKIEKTTKTCPWGAGLKMYILEYGFICLATKEGFLWLTAPK